MFKGMKKFSAAVGAAMAVTAATPAFATSTSGNRTVSWIQYGDDNNVPQLSIKLSDNVVYYANTGASCAPVPAPNVDTVKMWLSMAQAALLSGKLITISFQSCANYSWIVAVTLPP
jgi:hypothetical protein